MTKIGIKKFGSCSNILLNRIINRTMAFKIQKHTCYFVQFQPYQKLDCIIRKKYQMIMIKIIYCIIRTFLKHKRKRLINCIILCCDVIKTSLLFFLCNIHRDQQFPRKSVSLIYHSFKQFLYVCIYKKRKTQKNRVSFFRNVIVTFAIFPLPNVIINLSYTVLLLKQILVHQKYSVAIVSFSFNELGSCKRYSRSYNTRKY